MRACYIVLWCACQYWERVVFGVVGLLGGVGWCFLSWHDVQSVVDILVSALLSLVFVLNAVLVGTKLLRLDKVSECVRQRRQGVRVSCRNHEVCSELVFVSGASFAWSSVHCVVIFVCSPLVSSRRALSTCLCLVNIFVMSLFVCIAPRKRLWRRRTRSSIQSFVWWTKLQRFMGCLRAGKCLCLSVLSLLHLRENPPRRYFVFAPCNDSSRSPSTKGVVEQPLPDRYCFPQSLTFYLQTTAYTLSLPVTALARARPLA